MNRGEERLLADLIADGVCHVFNAQVDDEPTICIAVLCSDIFAWGCADHEPLQLEDVEKLHALHRADARWGAIKWSILHRRQRPQAPVLAQMQAEGAWDGDLAALAEVAGSKT